MTIISTHRIFNGKPVKIYSAQDFSTPQTKDVTNNFLANISGQTINKPISQKPISQDHEM